MEIDLAVANAKNEYEEKLHQLQIEQAKAIEKSKDENLINTLILHIRLKYQSVFAQCLIYCIIWFDITNFLVLEEKESEINKLHESHEIQIKQIVEDSQNTLELTKQQSIDEEVSKRENDHENQLKEKDRLYNDLLKVYNEKRDSWMLEKRVVYSTYLFLFCFKRL